MINENEVTSKLTFKFLLVGNSSVGKTSLVRRFCRDDFEENNQSTISVEFMTSVIKMDNGGAPVKLQIWDTAGQEQYHSLVKSYYRNAVGVILCFSLTDHDSFEMIEEWYRDVIDSCNPKAVVVLVGNKCDLKEEKRVTDAEAKNFAELHSIEYIETSAKENTNVHSLFYNMARQLYEMAMKGEIDTSEPLQASSLVKKKETSKKKCC